MATVYNRTETTLYLDLDLNVDEVAPGESIEIEVGNFYAVMFEGYGNDFFLVYIPPPGGAVSSNPASLSVEGQTDIHMHTVTEDGGELSIVYDYEEPEGGDEEGEEMDEGQGMDEGELNVEGDEEQEEENYE